MKKKMDFDEYQKLANKTAKYPVIGKRFVYPSLGLAGESGEVLEKVKKLFRDKNARVTKEFKQDLTKELGDVLWYVSQIATDLRIPLSEIAQTNIDKLSSRVKRGKINGSGDNR